MSTEREAICDTTAVDELEPLDGGTDYREAAADYSSRQAARDAEYERDYRRWVASLPPAERRRLRESGLDRPCVQRHGTGGAWGDAADSPLASHTPDIAALVDHEEEAPVTQPMRDATEILRHLVADVISEGNARLTVECLAVAFGLSAYNGESMTEIAKRHGISRAAVSKRCVDITEKLNLPPSRAMRSEMARKIYKRSQIIQHHRNNP